MRREMTSRETPILEDSSLTEARLGDGMWPRATFSTFKYPAYARPSSMGGRMTPPMPPFTPGPRLDMPPLIAYVDGRGTLFDLDSRFRGESRPLYVL